MIVIIVLVITAVVLLKDKNTEQIAKESINVEQLTNSFDDIFDNKENEYVVSQLYIKDEKAGMFDMNAHVPKLNIKGEAAEKINNEIGRIFIDTLMKIGNESTIYTICKMDFATEINGDILSLAIKCVLKEGSNPQRTIIKTYNYNLEENKTLEITELIKEDKQEKVQKQIEQKIETEIKREKTIIKQGYSVYRRNVDSDIYILENAKEFYLGKDKILYIIYCYGNSSYTTETDLIITKL